MGANEKHDAVYGLVYKDCIRVQRHEMHPGHDWDSQLEPNPGPAWCEGVTAADDARHRLGLAGPHTAIATPEPEAPKAAPMSPVGKWSVGIVALAIVAPFVAILWAWAADVVRSFG